ncbi:GDSL-type esterase/lipase family protein [Coraliomargarita algicola]|uniref:GDSL-type esterase/lipase family protein n=1 Tax=Coraliomargarita algicola TaxID=3092156 RepID=A0ABZ0RR23_9BACT|nr:GDSL-type esterase/lipase family protein [Coraliomargarita sp. J2-16]WPJ97342.1 GDSL-type esterase/lipase family protein [Coraliomargarita sp. J2-16]
MNIIKKLTLTTLFLAALNGLLAKELQPGEKMAILSGQSFETWGWGPSGYIRLVVEELGKTGVSGAVSICLENWKTSQMLAALDSEVIAKKPAAVLIIPGTRDYNVFKGEQVEESFKQNLSAVIEKLQTAQISMVLVTSYAKNSKPSERRNENTLAHNNAIRELAQTYQVALIDFVELLHSSDTVVPLDGSLAARILINQMLAAEVLRALDMSDEAIAAAKESWLDIPGVQFPPSLSVNTYERLKLAAKASGMDPADYITELLHNCVN